MGLAEATGRPQVLANPFGIPPLRRPLASRTLAALLFFVLVSATWSTFRFGKLAAEDFPFDTWTSCAVSDFLHGIKQPPDVAFLGSSLVLYPAGSVDADLLNHVIDGPHHHSILYFERKFFEQTGQLISTFNFAVPGEMPSDAYLITEHLFKGEKRPHVIVYGVGPRDFMDNLLPSPSATDPFHHLARFGDYSHLIDKVSPELSDRFNYELGRLFFTYGQKEDLSHGFDRGVSQLINAELSSVPTIPIYLRRVLLPEYHATEVGKQDCLFKSYATKPRPPFVDNISEYKKRYATLKWDTFLTQMEFLAKTMEVAHDRGIPFVLVSMPITDINRNMIAQTALEAYKRSLRLLAASKHATFVELDGTKNYTIADYEDTVHLHSGGGRKMFASVAQVLAHDPRVKEALAQAPVANDLKTLNSVKGLGSLSGLKFKGSATSPSSQPSAPTASSAPSSNTSAATSAATSSITPSPTSAPPSSSSHSSPSRTRKVSTRRESYL
jgi:hypothetical protein